MSCNHQCNQGRDCPVSTFYAETEGVFPMPTGCSLKAPINPANQPFPPIEPADTTGRMIDLGRWALLTVAVMAAAAAVAGFFNKG